jgi:hypothetical protein
MSRGITTTAANMIMLGLVATGSAPALAANYHDYHPWSRPNNSELVNYHPGYAGPAVPTGTITLIQFAINARHADQRAVDASL